MYDDGWMPLLLCRRGIRARRFGSPSADTTGRHKDGDQQKNTMNHVLKRHSLRV